MRGFLLGGCALLFLKVDIETYMRDNVIINMSDIYCDTAMSSQPSITDPPANLSFTLISEGRNLPITMPIRKQVLIELEELSVGVWKEVVFRSHIIYVWRR